MNLSSTLIYDSGVRVMKKAEEAEVLTSAYRLSLHSRLLHVRSLGDYKPQGLRSDGSLSMGRIEQMGKIDDRSTPMRAHPAPLGCSSLIPNLDHD